MHRLATLLLLLAALPWAAASLSAQQLALASNDNGSYGGYAVGWPASVIAFRFTANTPVLAAAQVFTGNQPPAVHTLEIRTRHATTGLPDQLLGQPGSWSTTHTRCWQGTTFAQPAVVTPGQDYFLVWRVTGMFHQHSVSADSEPSNVPIEVRISDGSTWHGNAMLAGKIRLYAPAAAGSLATYGSGKPGQYGVPTIGLQGFASIGSPTDVWLGSAARNVLAILVVGTPIPGGVPVGFAALYVTPDLLLTMLTRTHQNPLSGGISYSLAIPNSASAIGFPLSFQWGVFDPQAADGFSHSPAATALIQ
jgi:hypothetical protein